ncbi:hypothetical protein VTI74DRAFT_9138 [Chaetomium olivicolor]
MGMCCRAPLTQTHPGSTAPVQRLVSDEACFTVEMSMPLTDEVSEPLGKGVGSGICLILTSALLGCGHTAGA